MVQTESFLIVIIALVLGATSVCGSCWINLYTSLDCSDGETRHYCRGSNTCCNAVITGEGYNTYSVSSTSAGFVDVCNQSGCGSCREIGAGTCFPPPDRRTSDKVI